jgi:two-component system cell cycle response regulator
MRAVLRLELEAADYAVIEAEDGQQAVEQALAQAPSVILLDVEMPVLDGHQALAALKSDERTHDIPVVFLSGRGAGEDLVQALREGAHDYLRKPPEPAELLARVGAANRMKQLQDELRRVSRTDHLTGLANRRHVEEHLRTVLATAVRHGIPAAVLVVDGDHFKRINDERGHAGGDEVLIEVGRTLVSAVRTEDLVGRWGGEEFIVIAPHTAEAATAALAERLRAAVEQTALVTISIGGACTPAAADRLIETADRNLYVAKERGRNCVVIEGAS